LFPDYKKDYNLESSFVQLQKLSNIHRGKIFTLANLPKKFLKNREISTLINGDNSEMDSDADDNDSDLDGEHVSIEYTVEPCLLTQTTGIQREIVVDTEQPLHHFTEKVNIKWRGIPFEPHPAIFSQPTLKSAIPVGTPVSYFEKYFTSGLIYKFSKMTNIYALQNDAICKPTAATEIHQLFGLQLYMGINKLPRLHLYWFSLMGLKKFCRSTVTMLKRFCQLQNNLHITNNLEHPSERQDKFYKVCPLLDCIRRRCQELEVEQHVAVDEQMILFTGRHSCKQYIPKPPSPWALKSFVLCCKSGQPYVNINFCRNIL
jgi:hypothetical protein